MSELIAYLEISGTTSRCTNTPTSSQVTSKLQCVSSKVDSRTLYNCTGDLYRSGEKHKCQTLNLYIWTDRQTSAFLALLSEPKAASPLLYWLSVSACLGLEVIPIVPDVIIQITAINTNTIIASPASLKQHTLYLKLSRSRRRQREIIEGKHNILAGDNTTWQFSQAHSSFRRRTDVALSISYFIDRSKLNA